MTVCWKCWSVIVNSSIFLILFITTSQKFKNVIEGTLEGINPSVTSAAPKFTGRFIRYCVYCSCIHDMFCNFSWYTFCFQVITEINQAPGWKDKRKLTLLVDENPHQGLVWIIGLQENKLDWIWSFVRLGVRE